MYLRQKRIAQSISKSCGIRSNTGTHHTNAYKEVPRTVQNENSSQRLSGELLHVLGVVWLQRRDRFCCGGLAEAFPIEKKNMRKSSRCIIQSVAILYSPLSI